MSQPEPIYPALIEAYSRIQSRAVRRSGTFASRGATALGLAKLIPEPIDDEDSEIKNPVAEGTAMPYDTVVDFDGKLYTFVAGCFSTSIKSGKNIPLCVDHDEKCVLADKYSGFTVVESKEALDWCCDVPRSKNPMAILGLVSSENRRCISIGFKVLQSEIHNCAGRDVTFVTEAALLECSLVKRGRSVEAFAFVTDRKNVTPAAMGRSPTFERHQAAFLATRTGRAVKPTDHDTDYTVEQWNALSARLAMIEGQLGIPSPEAKAMLHREAHLQFTPQRNVQEANAQGDRLAYSLRAAGMGWWL